MNDSTEDIYSYSSAEEQRLLRDLVDSVEILIPVLNERRGIEMVLRELEELGIPRDRVLIVDGGSIDGSREYALNWGARVIIQRGRGKVSAIKEAIPHLRTGVVVVMDGDYTYPAKHIWDLLLEITRGKDLVIGARKKLEKGSMNPIYRLGNHLLTRIFNLLFGTRLSDVLSGMYAVRREILEEILYESRGFGIEAEIAAHAASTGRSISEVPIEYRRRADPRAKKLKMPHGLEIFADMVRLAWKYNPTFFIFLLGSLLLIPGLALGAYVGYYYIFEGVAYYVKGLIAISLTLAGFQSLLLSLLSLYIKRIEIRILREIKRENRERK